ncbi:Multidrug efflux pump subunit AcrB OS=Castellaniella defragrans OX=75697 GN=HNR28_001934 PE=4 SV=1 [Castellaniella denitrificans]|uniref:efflux RND transporter permease subunit n=1 Tax=Castellaniella denitrificans TaxID=56119 RepID=UPI00360751DE
MKTAPGIAGRITALFQDNRLTPLLALALLLAGLFALAVTPREEEPQIDVTMATIMVAWPGASADDVEHVIATPGERILARMEGTEHVTSMSMPGQAVLTVQFKVGIPRTEALVRLHDTLRTQSSEWLPPELGIPPPVVRPRGVDDVPIVALTLHAADKSPRDLEWIARSIEPELKRVPGTRDVWLIGGADNTVRVDLDAGRMAAAGVTAQDVARILDDANHRLHAGDWIAADRSLAVDAGQFLRSGEDVAELIVARRDGHPVRLREIARVEEGPPPPDDYVGYRAAGRGGDAETAVTLAITKKPGENAIDVSNALMRRVDELRNAVIPPDVQVTETRNYGATADAKAGTLIHKLIFATLSVVLLVLLALGWREAVIVGLAVGLTLAATLFASWAWGFTLNRVSLFALIFSIGILVDDAIVVVENIHRHAGLHPERPAAQRIPMAVDEVGGPTILATFTVIAALLPMAFVTGLMGPYMSPIPINASMGMLISLGIALTLTPWLAMRMGTPGHPKGEHRSARHEGGPAGAQAPVHPSAGPGRALRFFQRLMAPFLTAPHAGRNRIWLGLATLGLVLGSMLMPALGWVELKMLPFDNKSEFQVMVRMPAGTPLERTHAVLQALGDLVLAEPEVTDIQTYAGTASPINFNGLVRQYDLRRDPALGDIQVNLVDKSRRDAQSHDIAMRIRPILQETATRLGADIQVVEVPPGPPVQAPIVAEIYGPDPAGRDALTGAVRKVFEQTGGMVDIDDSRMATAPRIVLAVDRERAARAGVSQEAIVQTLKAGLSGLRVGVLRDGHSRPTAIVLGLPPEYQGDPGALLRLPVRAEDGAMTPIGELVREIRTTREQPIHHKDLLPVQYVTADMAGRIDSPLYGMFAARAALKRLDTPDGRPLAEFFTRQPEDAYGGYAIKWDGEWQITYETFRDMGLAYAVGLLLIYLLVVAHFGSYLMPLIIMAPIPLTLIGVMPGHALLGKQFTATSMIGMIALAGIIVRNSILLVDFILMRLREGSGFAQAVVESAATRAQPILLTGLAAMLGAFFILDDPIFSGLAIALISGIAISTALTLIIIPILFFSAFHKRAHTLVPQGDPS